MTEAEWLKSDDPQAMLAWLCERPGRDRYAGASDRKLRLFACARWRVSPVFLVGDRVALDVLAGAEAMADGAGPPVDIAGFKPLLPDAAEAALGMAAWCRPGHAEGAAAAALLRDIVGDPFRRFAWSRHHDASPSGHELQFLHEDWRTHDVQAIAQAAYDDRDFAASLPVLADALEDAGCVQEELLRHLRGFERCPGCRGEGRRRSYRPEDIPTDETEISMIRAGIVSLPKPTGDEEPCPGCEGSGYISLRAPHALGCWALDTIVGKE